MTIVLQLLVPYRTSPGMLPQPAALQASILCGVDHTSAEVTLGHRRSVKRPDRDYCPQRRLYDPSPLTLVASSSSLGRGLTPLEQGTVSRGRHDGDVDGEAVRGRGMVPLASVNMFKLVVSPCRGDYLLRQSVPHVSADQRLERLVIRLQANILVKADVLENPTCPEVNSSFG